LRDVKQLSQLAQVAVVAVQSGAPDTWKRLLILTCYKKFEPNRALGDGPPSGMAMPGKQIVLEIA
jgi:hypothetical protein